MPIRFAEACKFRLFPVAICVAILSLLMVPATRAQSGQTIQVANGDVAGLIAAIQMLNGSGGGTIDLASSGLYQVSAPSDWWYGPNAFPAISSVILINGNGATISRTSGSPKFRFFYVSGGFSTLPAGNLTLNDLTLSNGLAQGGSGGASGYNAGTGGGGAGMGGAIYNQGTTEVVSVTFSSNTARGGDAGLVCPSHSNCGGPSGGGGMGGNGGDFAVGGRAGAGGGFRYGGSGQTGGGFMGNEGGSPWTGGLSTLGGNGGAGNSGGGGGGGYASGQNGASGAGTQSGGAGAFGAGEGGGTTYPNSNGCGSGGGGAFGGGGGVDSEGSGCAGGNAGYGGGGGIGGGGAVGSYGPGNGGYGGGGAGQQTCTCNPAGSYGCGHGAGGFGGGGGACTIFYSGDVEPSGGFGAGNAGEPYSGDFQGGGGGGFGGAIFNQLGSVSAISSTFTGNAAAGGSGGYGGSGLGGAVFNLNGTMLLDNMTYSGNTASTSSGGNVAYNLSHNGGNTTSSQTSAATLKLMATTISATNGDLTNNQVNGTATVTTVTAPIAVLSVTSLDFGSQYDGYTTPAQSLTITNMGNAPLTFSALGSESSFYVQTNSLCGSSLAAGASCTANLTFTPEYAGAENGQYAFVDNSYLSTSQFVNLYGSGIQQGPVTQIGFAAPPPATIVAGGNAGIVTLLAETSDGVQNYSSNQTVVLTVSGPSGYVQYYAGSSVAGAYSFDLTGVPLTVPGTYSYKAGTYIYPNPLPGVTDYETVVSLADNFGSSTSVGTPSSAQTLTLLFSTAGTLNSIQVLTQGAPNLDFSLASGGTCAVGTTYAAQQTCTVNVVFTPMLSGSRNGAVLLTDGSGNVLATSYVSGIGQGPQVAYGPAVQSTVGGGLNAPAGVAVDTSGNVYIADTSNARVLKLPWTGSSYGAPVQLGSGLYFPFGVAVDGNGNVYIADTDNSRVLKLPWNGTSYGAQITIPGGWSYPYAMAIDGAGNLFVADTYNSRIVKLPWAGNGYGAATTVGSGFNHPAAVAVDGVGNVYVADSYNQQVVEVPWTGSGYGTQTTIGGFFYDPEGVAVDGNGNVYVTDIGNAAAYEVPWTGSGFGPRTSVGTGLNTPEGIFADSIGDIFIADRGRSSVFKVDMADAPSINFPTSTAVGTIDTTDGPKTVSITNIGNQPLVFAVPESGTNPSYPSNFPMDAASTCNGSPLAPESSCVLAADFAPQEAGTNAGNIILTDNNLSASANVVQSISLTGTAILVPTQLRFSVPPAANIPVGGNAGSGVTVEEETVGGLLATSSSDQVTLTVKYPDNTTQTYTQTASSGVATFNLSKPGLFQTGTYTYTAICTGLTSAVASEMALTHSYTAPVTKIGTADSVQTATMVFTAKYKVGGIGVLTQGAPDLDFQLAAGGTCAVGSTYNSGQSCTVNYIFNPTHPGPRYGAIVLSNSTNPAQQVALEYLQGRGNGPQVIFPVNTAQSAVGSGFSSLSSIAVDGAGNVFVADSTNNVVQEIVAAGGYTTVKTLGSGFSCPKGVAVDGGGNVFVADSCHNAVKEIVAVGGYTTVKTLGSGFSAPVGVAVDGHGNVYVADTGHYVVKQIAVVGGYTTVKTLGGSTPNVYPSGLALDGSADVFVADSSDNTVREISASGGYTTATLLASGFSAPQGMAMDAAGNLYVADSGNGVVKELLATGGFTAVMTLGSGFVHPLGVALGGNGNVFVADSGHSSVNMIDLSDPPSLTFATTQAGSTSSDSPQAVTVSNNGNSILNITGLKYATDFPKDPGTGTICTSSTNVASGGSCQLNINFSPKPASATAASTPLSESVTLTDNNLNGTSIIQSIGVNGTATFLTPALISPAPGSTLTGSSATFTWSAGSATSFQFRLGATTGSNSIYGSGQTNKTSETVNNLPTNGSTIHARLYYLENGTWYSIDYVYTAQ